MEKSFLVESIYGGIHKIYKFKNGYGASVVQHKYSYGGDKGLWELAVIIFNNKGEWDISYGTPITGDVIGYLGREEVNKLLSRIKKLKKPL